MISAKRDKSREEAGVLENLFVFAVVATAIITMGAFSIFVVEAQRYQAGLDLSTHTAIRDIVGSNFSQDPRRLAQSDLSTIFQEMGLATENTSVTVADTNGRCGMVTISEHKVLDLFWNHLIAVQLSSSQREPMDPLSSGLEGVATCIGS